jgi:hypothetical protein
MEVAEGLGAEHDAAARTGPGSEENPEHLLRAPVGVDVGGSNVRIVFRT